MNANRRFTIRWLTTRLATSMEVATSTIDPLVPLAEMGVDSVHAVALVGDIELQYDIDVDPTLIFDYPTIAAIAEYIELAVAESVPSEGAA